VRIVALVVALAFAVVAPLAGAASAQTYPSRILKLIVPFPAGGLVDSLARVLGEDLAAELGQAVVVDNRAGAAGKIGAQAAAQSPADGYTLFLATGTTHGTLPVVDPSFNPQRDFISVSLATVTPFILAVHPSLPVKTPQELIAYIKARPGALNYASPGTGSATHFAGELLKTMAGIDIVHVPYRGLAPALQDVIANHVQMTFDSTILSQLEAGQLKAIATTGLARSPFLPDVPTLDESGLKGFDIVGWAGISVPKGTSAEIVGKLNGAINASMTKPATKDRLRRLGLVAVASSPEQMDKVIKDGIERYREIARTARLKFKEPGK
jgi:tripartite-type tricarboxylate transporter receptor subunit TctC